MTVIFAVAIIALGIYALGLLFALGLGYGAKLGDEQLLEAYRSLRDGDES